MGQELKAKYLGELATIKALVSSTNSLTSGLKQPAYPVTGTMVTISSLPMAAQAIQMQAESITKLSALIEKILEDI